MALPSVLLAVTLLPLITSLPVSAAEEETCFFRQHRSATVSAAQTLNPAAAASDARVVPSEQACIRACCATLVKPGARCNMVVFNGNRNGGEENCFLFHCQGEQDCPLRKALDGTNTYDIYKEYQRCNSPAYHCDSPAYHCDSPAYHCDSPAYHRDSPAYHCNSPAYHCNSPAYHRDNPAYHRDSPAYHCNSPAYHCNSPAYHCNSPAHNCNNPACHPNSPAYHRNSPACHPDSPACHRESPACHRDSPACHNNQKNNRCQPIIHDNDAVNNNNCTTSHHKDICAQTSVNDRHDDIFP
ncbi:hypothetical protein D4764_22G0000290 [Takifugu flavidus]|uniref:MANSC domain-containing protein n=1 Tax=Takifugu flavidus TaxID=433684 RepID=A0A5C6NA60_9TELE|nr:hypothetical protein D4764_22G0000290 [Takifugu flavidus]